MERYPVFINNRNRLAALCQLIAWLERAHQTEIYLIDNDSSYPPLLEYYEHCPYPVIRLGQNVGHTAPWKAGVVAKYARGRYYVVTDPDVVPIDICPDDAIARFRDLLDTYPSPVKVGFGIKIDDLPEHYEYAGEVRAWEGQFWEKPLEPGVFEAPIDTTFALYRPCSQYALDALRTGEPYLVRHLPWYVDSHDPGDEDRYYSDHTNSDFSHWNASALPERMTKLLAGEVVRYRSQVHVDADVIDTLRTQLRATEADLRALDQQLTTTRDQLAALESLRSVRLARGLSASLYYLRTHVAPALISRFVSGAASTRGPTSPLETTTVQRSEEHVSNQRV